MEAVELKNVTELDAHTRVTYAMMGSHAGATDTFLIALRAKLYGWIAQIDAELAVRNLRHQKRLEAMMGEREESMQEAAERQIPSFVLLNGKSPV